MNKWLVVYSAICAWLALFGIAALWLKVGAGESWGIVLMDATLVWLLVVFIVGAILGGIALSERASTKIKA